MKNIKKRSIDAKRQKHRYNMFITEQRGYKATIARSVHQSMGSKLLDHMYLYILKGD